MRSLHTPLTMMQSTDDPEYLAVRERFWQRSQHEGVCEHCGESFRFVRHASGGPRKYCSKQCAYKVHVQRELERFRQQYQDLREAGICIRCKTAPAGFGVRGERVRMCESCHYNYLEYQREMRARRKEDAAA